MILDMENIKIEKIKEAGNVVISNPERFEQVKKEIIEDGIDSVHILADFDKTLTRQFVDGKEELSFVFILRDRGYLIPDYSEKAKALYNTYHAIEIDPNIPKEEKIKAMHEWWTRHYEFLIESKLNKKDVASAVESGHVEFREGALNFFDFLKDKNVPLVIISSSGLGTEAIEMYIKNAGKLYDNVHIVSNEFEWDGEGYLVKVKEPIIHAMNKNETTLKESPFFDEIKDRKNIILLGDSPDDLGMAEGFEYKNMISVGFLNKNIESNIENYKKIFDSVITGDSDLFFVNDLLKEISR